MLSKNDSTLSYQTEYKPEQLIYHFKLIVEAKNQKELEDMNDYVNFHGFSEEIRMQANSIVFRKTITLTLRDFVNNSKSIDQLQNEFLSFVSEHKERYRNYITFWKIVEKPIIKTIALSIDDFLK